MEWSWYGWQTLLVDGASVLLLTGADDGTAGPAIGTYIIGPPIVHWSHGNVGRGFASLGLRLGAPLTLALAFGGSCDESPYSHGTCMDDFFVGVLVGVGSAMLLDAFALSWEKEPRNGSPASIGTFALTPAVSRDGHGGTVMATGTF